MGDYLKRRHSMDQERVVVSRRGIIQAGILAGIGATAIGAAATTALGDIATRGKAFRVAHLTDIHIVPGKTRSGDGYAMALQSLEKLSPKADLLITGGDHVMDSLETNHDKLDPTWDLYQKTLKDSTDYKPRPVIGNHDVLGWGAEASKIPLTTVGYGKALYCDKMALDKTYYSFDSGGWHFIVLDNIQHGAHGGYGADIDPEQLEWLKGDLDAVSKQTPICVLTHIPILAVCTYFFNDYKGPGYTVSAAMMQQDAHKLITLLRGYNVKLCISGHVHMVDRIEYLGITFICDGAVSGNWWKGKHHEFDEGYGVFDFFPDGTFEHVYQTYGWKAAV
jgi:3',5'-cyclic-AMP phosphodiesterase